MDDTEFFRTDAGVVLGDVLADSGRDANDGFPLRHDGGVGTDGVEAVYGSDKLRATGRWHLSPGKPGEPGGHSGAGVEDVGLFGVEDVPQGADLG